MSEPKPAADLLKGILLHARTMAGRQDLNLALREVLGEELAGHCQVSGFKNGKLVVEVDSAPLYSELSSFRREEIREAMNAVISKNKIAQLNFRMGGTGHV